MNPIIFILLCFAALGLFDKMFKNRLGLATSFDRGIITMGDFMMSVGGFYCISTFPLSVHRISPIGGLSPSSFTSDA